MRVKREKEEERSRMKLRAMEVMRIRGWNVLRSLILFPSLHIETLKLHLYIVLVTVPDFRDFYSQGIWRVVQKPMDYSILLIPFHTFFSKACVEVVDK